MKRIDTMTLAMCLFPLFAACGSEQLEGDDVAFVERDLGTPPAIAEFPQLPNLNSGPMGITKAADGSLWFAMRNANRLGRMTTDGALTQFQIPTASSGPEHLTASPDGYVWFTERYGKKIGRIHQSGGAITEFLLPGYGEFPTGLTTDQNGRVWFASNQSPNVARIGWISLSGTITHLVTASTATSIMGIVAGPDGNLWVTRVSSQWGDAVCRVVPIGYGTWTNYRLPNSYSSPQGITVGPDGALWFTEKSANKIGRMTIHGVLTEFALPAGGAPQRITAGPDGALWFTEQSGNRIGQITTAGVVTELDVPTANSQPFGIVTGADANLYFTEYASYGNRLGKVY